MELRRIGNALVAALLPVLLLGLSGCGAGLITGVAASGGGSTADARQPTISGDSSPLPLVAAPGASRTIVVSDAELAGGGDLEVRVVNAEVGTLAAVLPVLSATNQGGATLITFGLASIADAAGGVTSADVTANLSVWAAGRRVAGPVPTTLLRQPVASLVLPTGAATAFLSPLGQRVEIDVDGLHSTAAEDVQVLVRTPDPASASTIERFATDIRFESALNGVPRLSALVPGNSFPVVATLIVRDAVAGVSTEIRNAYYRPDIALALPSQGPTTGGSLLTLIGTALVPYDFSTTPARFDFDRVTLSFFKGERLVELPRADFRTEESDSDRLVFTMPPSPDGRPGSVDIILRVELDGIQAEVIASEEFLFANPDPFYGPRGAVLDRIPVAAVPIPLDNAPSTAEAPDFAILTEQGGVGFLQLVLALQNGMFQPFAAPLQIGDHEAGAERSPQDLVVGDFDGDAVPDLFIVNEGGATASHLLVLGQARPLPPLGAVHRVSAPPGSYRARVARFDGDQLPDVLLVPGPNAPSGQLPHVLLARPAGVGQPGFSQPIEVAVRAFPYEAFEVADFNDDGVPDVAVASGSQMKLDVALGNGDGSFALGPRLDPTIPGYQPDPQSPAVGLHACRNAPEQSLAIVLAGIGGSPVTQPTVAVFSQQPDPTMPGGFTFADPEVQNVYIAPVEPIGLSLAANLDETSPGNGGPLELVVAIRGEPALVALGLLQFADQVFEPLFPTLEGGAIGGAESPVQIRSLAFAKAFTTPQNQDEAAAVFIVHEVDVDGARERRLSTRLVSTVQGGDPVLLPPDAGARLGFEVEGVVGGNFTPTAANVEPGVGLRDLAVASRSGLNGGEEITVVANDGFGGFPSLGGTLSFPGLLPDSLARVPVEGAVEPLVFVASDSRVGHWLHPAPTAVESPRLRDVLGAPLGDLAVDDDTRVRVADVDGDGVQDLVVLLSFGVAMPGEGDSRIALMRGKAAFGPGEFPFHVPTQLTAVHGNARGLALGDLNPQTAALELVVAVPTGTTPSSVDGDHLRFYRYQAGTAPEHDRFVFSAVPSGPQALLAGSEPALVAASDFDRDGLVDLMVACRGDSTLRVFRNTFAPGGGSTEVDVARFVETLASPNALAPGNPTALRLGDVNGDGNLDAVVFSTYTGPGGVRSSSVATYLSGGTGEFEDARFASTTRVGGFDAEISGDLGDWNRDGVPDLFVGWKLFQPALPPVNLRVLFGGTR